MTQCDQVNDSSGENGLQSQSAKRSKLSSKEEISELLEDVENHKLILKEKWYVVSLVWWKTLTQALKSGYLEDVGPMDSQNISQQKGGKWFLRPKLVERIDYMLLPEQVFLALYSTFGAENESRDVIERLVEMNPVRGLAFVEVYPRSLTVTLARDRSVKETLPVSLDDTVQTLSKKAVDALKLGEVASQKLRFYIYHSDDERYELLSMNDAKQNYEHFFAVDQLVVVDVLDENGTGFLQAKPVRTNANGAAGQNGAPYHRIANQIPGVCGLQNLGNTCFMASALQCLSNVPPITEYFLSERYQEEINEENPLGTQGELAKAYASLIQNMWGGENSAVMPRQLKMTIGQFAPRFSGYSQQDSQELMAFLLDGLHEDLNRIKKKPYIEEDDNSDGRPDEELATLQWEQYKARNDSIIVDRVHGQIKSTLVCPICQKISIKFDPFCFLSLPLPPREKVVQQNFVLIFNPIKKWAKFSMKVTRGTTVAEATAVMRNTLGNGELKVVMWTADGSDNVKVLSEEDYVAPQYSYSNSCNTTYAAELDAAAQEFVVVKSQSSSNHRPLALPMVFGVSEREDVTRHWVEGVAIPFIRNQFFKDPNVGDSLMESDDCAPYEILVEKNGSVVPFADGAVGAGTVVVRWRTPSLFNGYVGKELVERECSVAIRTEIHLTDCIDLFTKEEQLGEQDSWYCPRCKKHQRASKKLDLWKLPEILIVHLKRFQYTRWNREKIDIQVHIPVSAFELNDKLANAAHEHVQYDLIAMSHHMGGLGGGHYTASALNPNGKWYDFNDSSTNERNAPADPFKASTPYMLVYRRRNTAGHVVDENIEMETDEC